MMRSRVHSSIRSVPSAVHAIALLPLALALFTSGGCQAGGTGQPVTLADLFRPRTRPPAASAPAPAEPVDAPFTASGALHQPGTILLQLQFDVLRTRVPRGVFSESGKIWNHLDEQIAPADLVDTLHRNGLRVARGKLASWPPIKALLDAERDVQTAQNSMGVANGLPFIVELDRQPRDQTLFVFRRDGSLGGVTLTSSTNLLRIEYGIPVTHPNSIVVDVMPEIRQTAAERELSLKPQDWANRPPLPPTRVFRELAVRMQIGPDEFVAVGPSPSAHQTHTMGSLLLCQDVDGRRYECMIFVTPRVIHKELHPGARRVAPGADFSHAGR